MKRPAILFCLLGITLGVAAVYLFQSRDAIGDWFTKPSATSEAAAPQVTETPPPQPEYDDVAIIGERFVLASGQGRAYHLTAVRNSEPFRIRWASNLPVDVGVVASVLAAQAPDARVLLATSYCHELTVTMFDHTCRLPAETEGIEMSLLVFDSRTGASTLGSIGAALLGSRRSLDEATQNNNAAIALMQRRCVANCP